MFAFGKKKERDVEALKRQQIEGLKAQVPLARAVNAEETIFDILIPSASAAAVLRVQLPPQFPDHAPSLRILGLAVRHQWVDPQGVVAYHPRLNPWSANNNLAEVTQQVIMEITKAVGGSPTVGTGFNSWGPYPGQHPNAVGGYPGQSIPYQGSLHGSNSSGSPPTNPQQPMGVGIGGAQPYMGSGLGNGYQMQGSSIGGQQQTTPPRPERPPINLPPLPSSLPDIMDRPIDDLNKLLTDDVTYSIFFSNLSQVKECNRQLEAIRRTNADIAKSNLSQRDDLEGLRKEVSDLLSGWTTARNAYDAKLKSNKGIIGGSGAGEGDSALAEVITGLEQEMNDSEQKSEEVAKRFTTGELKLPDFSIDFLKERKKYHERSAKLEAVRAMAAGRLGR